MDVSDKIQEDVLAKKIIKKVLPFIIFFAFAGGAYFVQTRLDLKDQRIDVNNAQGVADQIALRLEDAVNSRIKSLDIMAARLSAMDDFNQTEFLKYAEKIHETLTGFQAVNWIDSYGFIRWIYPVAPNLDAEGKDIHQHPEKNVRISFRQAEQKNVFSLTPAIELFQGGQGMAAYFPLITPAGKLRGYLNGVFRIGDLVNACLPDWKDRQPLHFAIREGEKEIYWTINREDFPDRNDENLGNEKFSLISADINVGGNLWTLVVCPWTLPKHDQAALSNRLIFHFGVMMAFGLAVLVFFLIRRNNQNRIARNIAENAQKFSANILSTMPSALLVLDQSFTIRLANPSFLCFCTPGLGDVTGKKLFEVLKFKHARAEAVAENRCPFCDTVNSLFADGIPVFNKSIMMHTLDGQESWIRLSCVSISNAGENEALVVFNDITSQKKLQRAFELRRKHLETILRDAPDAVITINTEKQIVEWNPGAERLFGYRSEEAVGRDIEKLLGGKELGDAAACISTVLETGRSIAPVEVVRHGKHKDPVDVIVTASPIYDQGELTGVIGIYTDITALKQARIALEEREELYRNFIQLSSEAIWRFDFEKPLLTNLTLEEQLDWGYEYAYLAECNDAMARMYGLKSKEQIIGARLNDLLPRTDLRNTDFLSALIRNNYSLNDVESCETGAEGETIIFLNNMVGMVEDGYLMHLWGTQRDITQRKKAEEALISSEERYRTLVETAPEIVFTIDRDSMITSVNPIFEKISGFKTDQWLGEKFSKFVHQDDLKLAELSIKRTLQGKSAQPIELKFIHRDGGYRIMEVTAARMIENNETVGLVGVTRDITGQKEAQSKLAESELRNRTLVETSPDAILLAALDGKILMINQRGVEILGAISAEQVIGKNPLDYLPEQDSKKLQLELESIVTTGRGRRLEYSIPRSGGKSTPIETNISLVKNVDGSPQAYIVMARDVTNRKEAEKTKNVLYEIANSVNVTEDLTTLIENIRQYLGKLMDTTNFFIALYNPEDDTISMPYIKDQKDSFDTFPAGKTFTSYVIKNDLPLLIKESEAHEMIRSGKIEQHGSMSKVWLGVPLKSGNTVIGSVAVQDYHSQDAFTEKHLDILKFVSDQIALAIQRKRSESALRHSEERYRTVVEGSLNGIIILNDNYRITFSNEEGGKITGYPVNELLNMDFRELVDPENVEIVAERYKKRQLGEMVPPKYEVTITRKDGKTRMVEIVPKILKDSKGTIQTIVQVRDVTEQKVAEIALKSSEELNRGIVTNAPIGILYLDREGIIIHENPAMIKMTGRAESRTDIIVGSRLADIPAVQSDISSDLRALLDGSPIAGVEIEYKTPGGEIRRIELHGSPRRGIEGNLIGAVIMCFDMTEYKAMEAHLRHAQKMEAIGTLAGGIAHDFNNLLTGIMGNVELVMLGLEPHDAIYDKLAQMQKSAERAAELTAQLLAFGRQRMEQPKPVNLNSAIDEAAGFIKHTIDKKVELKVVKEPSLWVVKADLGQMNQILINLMVNAADAMPNGGRLILKSSNSKIDRKHRNSNADARPGDFVKIDISDTGEGIPPDLIDRIFEPFFTTKPIGKGTGLGLAMVYGIIRGHDGWIEVRSKVGKGTAFNIFLPRAIEEIDSIAETKNVDFEGGIETILLVDDEEIVRTMGQTMLERFGYKVILAENGQEGLDLYKKQMKKIGIVILDVTMPIKSGRETLVELIDLNPKIKVVVSSGFDRSGPVEELMRLGAKGFVQKPYKIGEMLQVVRGVLDMKNVR